MKNLKATVKALSIAAVASVMFSSCTIIMPVAATSNNVGSKHGTAKATTLFGFIHIAPDASIESAAKNGGISRISTVDMKTTNYLGIVIFQETIVTGE
ncbi:MAG: hypothetical protein EBZ77_11010 [Chitinophagia bacterium]|nr:hypothetical protein [Chitinophagia bacterium]